jgi:hypothetical protein
MRTMSIPNYVQCAGQSHPLLSTWDFISRLLFIKLTHNANATALDLDYTFLSSVKTSADHQFLLLLLLTIVDINITGLELTISRPNR